MDTPSGIKDSIPAWIKFSVQAPGEIPYNGIYYDPPEEVCYRFSIDINNYIPKRTDINDSRIFNKFFCFLSLYVCKAKMPLLILLGLIEFHVQYYLITNYALDCILSGHLCLSAPTAKETQITSYLWGSYWNEQSGVHFPSGWFIKLSCISLIAAK